MLCKGNKRCYFYIHTRRCFMYCKTLRRHIYAAEKKTKTRSSTTAYVFPVFITCACGLRLWQMYEKAPCTVSNWKSLSLSLWCKDTSFITPISDTRSSIWQEQTKAGRKAGGKKKRCLSGRRVLRGRWSKLTVYNNRPREGPWMSMTSSIPFFTFKSPYLMLFWKPS